MALHTDPRPDASATGHGRTIGHRARRLWTLALLLALAIAATLENSNRREDRVNVPAPAAPTPPPNARGDRSTGDH